MSILSNINSLLRRNAVQATDSSNNQYVVGNNSLDILNYNNHSNLAGKYDNFYGDANKLVIGAAKYEPYYSIDNEVVEPKLGNFAYYLANPNDSYPLRKVLEQVYTELITKGHSQLFLWRKAEDGETVIFEPGKLYNEDDYRGFTLVSGYDKSKFSAAERANIVNIIYGANQANVFMGYSPTQAAQAWRKMQDEMGLHMTNFAKNAGMPLGTFIIASETPEEYVKIKDELLKRTVGAKNAGKVLTSWKPGTAKNTSPQIQWVQFSSSDVQDYTSQMEFAEKKTTQMFGVPGTIKGTNDGENYATANVSKRNFVEWSQEPLVATLNTQLEFAIKKRFELKGDVKIDVPIPELADESLVKIQATTQAVTLYDQKIAEGWTPESIVQAYDLPERFLLLKKAEDIPTSHVHDHHHAETEDKLDNMTAKERKEFEAKYREITEAYAKDILANGASTKAREQYETAMVAEFGSQFEVLYDKNLDKIAKALVDELGTVDIADLNLTDDEIQEVLDQYNRRVKDFSKSFTEQVAAIEGTETEAWQGTKPKVERVVVNEAQHGKIVSELRGWTKAQDQFPVRVTKTWKALPTACSECQAINGTTIDVTALFVNNPTDEIYEVQGGGLHVNCRCVVVYEMEAEKVREHGTDGD